MLENRAPKARASAALSTIGLSLAALSACVQLALLLYVMLRRIGYPFDLEWLEGSMLCHALRLLEGKPIYVAPSADFIPLLYTPLYPALLAGLARVFGLSYALARGVSIVCFVGVLALVYRTVRREAGDGPRAHLWAIVPVGLIAAAYPITASWYDLARSDSLYLLLITLTLTLLREAPGRVRVLVAAGVCGGLAFLAKQTASVFIVFSGLAVLFTDIRRLPVYVGVVGLVAGGATLALDYVSDGWFWRYVFGMHQGHAFDWAHFFPGAELALLRRFPVASALSLGCIVALAVRWRQTHVLTAAERGVLYWLAVAGTGVLAAATGYATQWAATNALIPGVVFPALFLGVALPRVAGWLGRRADALLGVAHLGLAAQLALTLYDPARFVPTAAMHQAGARLLALARSFEGPVLIPSHPYYAVLAGKTPSYQAMGIPDVTAAGYPFPEDLERLLASGYYEALIFDFIPEPPYPRALVAGEAYRLARELAEAEAPRAISGARVRPRYLYLRAK